MGLLDVITFKFINLKTFRQPVDVVMNRRRVECVIVVPVGQNQSLNTTGVLNQVFQVLQSRNFSEQETENRSGMK